MANYLYRCAKCGREDDKDYPIGTAIRVTRCVECGGVMRLRIGVGVNISASALATKGAPVTAIDKREGEWQKDIPAYRRMRRKGMQPKGIDGSAKLEDRVGDQFDVNYRDVMDRTGATRERVMEGVEQAAEIIDTVKSA